MLKMMIKTIKAEKLPISVAVCGCSFSPSPEEYLRIYTKACSCKLRGQKKPCCKSLKKWAMTDAYLGISIALSASGLTAFSLLLQKYIRRKEANNRSNPSILEEESFSDLHQYCLSTISFLLLLSGYLLDALSINYLSLSIVGVLTTSQLVFGAILACVLANEQIGVWGWVGIVGNCEKLQSVLIAQSIVL